jgi:hypothetical protein
MHAHAAQHMHIRPRITCTYTRNTQGISNASSGEARQWSPSYDTNDLVRPLRRISFMHCLDGKPESSGSLRLSCCSLRTLFTHFSSPQHHCLFFSYLHKDARAYTAVAALNISQFHLPHLLAIIQLSQHTIIAGCVLGHQDKVRDSASVQLRDDVG